MKVSEMKTLSPMLVKTTMFYDGGCPLCSREVAHYRRMDKTNNIHWLDIDSSPQALDHHGITYQQAMRYLHVLKSDGKMVKGAYAFQAIWLELPRYKYLGKLASFPGFLPMMEKLYKVFAERRYKKRVSCSQSNR